MGSPHTLSAGCLLTVEHLVVVQRGGRLPRGIRSILIGGALSRPVVCALSAEVAISAGGGSVSIRGVEHGQTRGNYVGRRDAYFLSAGASFSFVIGGVTFRSEMHAVVGEGGLAVPRRSS